MSERGSNPRRPRRRPPNRRTLAGPIAIVAGCVATVAPAHLTGVGSVDAVQRALLAGFVTYVGAHGRRRTWLIVGAIVAVPSGGVSLLMVLAGLAIVVASTFQPRRSQGVGAAGLALIVNATLWYPDRAIPYGPAIALVAYLTLVASGWRHLHSSPRRTATAMVAVTFGAAVVASAAVGAALLLAAADVRSGADAAQVALESARDGDAERAKAELDAADASFASADEVLDGPMAIPARLVPGISQQLRAVHTTVQQGRSITSVGDDVVATADYGRLKYDGRLDLVQVQALVEPTKRADAALATAASELAVVLDGRLLPPLRDRVTQFSDQVTSARRDTRLARALVGTAPQLLGATGDRSYLVIFTTPAELRGAGGFIGSFAELAASDGGVDLVRSGRIEELIEGAPRGTRTLSGPEDYLARYGAFRPQEFLQDATFSPHFPSSASVIAELYPQSGGTPVDGVIGVDPTGLAALLELTGPVAVDGLDTELSAANAVDILTRRQYLELGTRAERGEFLAEATRVTFERLVDASLPSPRALAEVLSPATRAGHLRLWSPIDEEQDLFESLGADGSLAIPDGHDGFSVVQRNVGNNKIDAYLRRTITYDARVDGETGALEATLRIELHNDVPAGELPPAVIDNTRAAPTGTNVTVVSVHTPHQVLRATLDGLPILMGPGSERGLNAWDTSVIGISAGATVVIEVELVGGIDLSDGYELRILPQPVANPDILTASLTVDRGRIRGTNAVSTTTVEEGPLREPVRRSIPLRR